MTDAGEPVVTTDEFKPSTGVNYSRIVSLSDELALALGAESIRIERIPGVASLNVRGGLNREIHVNLNADKIKALGLSMDMIISRIRAENVNVPAGTIGNPSIL